MQFLPLQKKKKREREHHSQDFMQMYRNPEITEELTGSKFRLWEEKQHKPIWGGSAGIADKLV